MPGKYKITAEVVIATQVEPDGYIDAYDALEFEDTSSFYGEDIRATGSCEFIVEADTEDEANDKAREILDNISFHSNDIEWEIEDTSIENVEEIEPPMDMERALGIIRAFIARMREMGGVTREEEEAISFLLDNLTP
jgi:hypothetical protein